jgi:signal transduction histidine kinase
MLQQTLAAADDLSTPLQGLTTQGVVLSGPLPLLSLPDLLFQLSTWVLTHDSLSQSSWMPFLLPASFNQLETPHHELFATPTVLPLLPSDPLAAERFCLVSTSQFSLVMVLGESLAGEPAFMYSFMPDVVQQAWDTLRPRILLTMPHQIETLDQQMQQFIPVAPNYERVMQFNRLLLEHLPEPEDSRPDRQRSAHNRREEQPAVTSEQEGATSTPDTSPDVELLQAIAHEVRTPLATIRTLTRSLLKRTDLPAVVVKRLESIDRECSEQIDRFSLFFRAVELETATNRSPVMPLTRTSVEQVLKISIPRWQQQANQRQLNLDVVMPETMPAVVSDPTMLDQALTSLIERFTRSLPTGSHIRVEVVPAGNQLKVQLQSQPDATANAGASCPGHDMMSGAKSLGQLLTFQPETGSITLNLSATKSLFQALGGKLIVKQRPQQGEVMTVFLPLEKPVPPIEFSNSGRLI